MTDKPAPKANRPAKARQASYCICGHARAAHGESGDRCDRQACSCRGYATRRAA